MFRRRSFICYDAFLSRTYLLGFVALVLFMSACGLTDQFLGDGEEAVPTVASVAEAPTEQDDPVIIPSVTDTPPTTVPNTQAPAAETGPLSPDQNLDPIVPGVQEPITDLTAALALENTLVSVYERVAPSVVFIQTNGGTGSGFVWDLDGHIVTNNHVIAGANQIVVTFHDGRSANASIVGTDPDSDLAVLRLVNAPTTLVPIQVGDSTVLKVGELAVAIGNPFGQTGTMTVGFISALGRLQPVDNSGVGGGAFNMSDMIQTDAAINPGNSGGVLVDENGLLIGVTSSIISPVRGSTGIGLAIPAVAVKKIAPALITFGQYQHPYLGVSGATLSSEGAVALGLPAETRGTLLVEVVPNGPAAQSGLRGGQQNGDVVIGVNGTPIGSMDELITFLARYGTAGEAVNMTIIRDGQQTDISVVLGARPG